MKTNPLIAAIENAIFSNRRMVIAFFIIITLVMLFFARGLHIDAGFTKTLPVKHPYMQTYLDHQEQFGGANRILVALVDKNGDMFNPKFMSASEGGDRRRIAVPAGRGSRQGQLHFHARRAVHRSR